MYKHEQRKNVYNGLRLFTLHSEHIEHIEHIEHREHSDSPEEEKEEEEEVEEEEEEWEGEEEEDRNPESERECNRYFQFEGSCSFSLSSSWLRVSLNVVIEEMLDVLDALLVLGCEIVFIKGA